MRKFIHHKIPQSRGGSDDSWNLIELDVYEHAYEHALDFVLFSSSPLFDCRQPGWKLLPQDLKDAVRKEISNRMKGNKFAVGSGESRKGKKNGMWGRRGSLHPCFGRKVSQEHREVLSKANLGRVFTDEHKKNLSKARTGKKMSDDFRIKRSNDATGRFWVTDDRGCGRMLKAGTPLPEGYTLGRPKVRELSNGSD